MPIESINYFCNLNYFLLVSNKKCTYQRMGWFFVLFLFLCCCCRCCVVLSLALVSFFGRCRCHFYWMFCGIYFNCFCSRKRSNELKDWPGMPETRRNWPPSKNIMYSDARNLVQFQYIPNGHLKSNCAFDQISYYTAEETKTGYPKRIMKRNDFFYTKKKNKTTQVKRKITIDWSALREKNQKQNTVFRSNSDITAGVQWTNCKCN